ncbi:RraA family protein [Bordetella genomosp. 4]|uniref:Putative 4-hydroxy-4-methyl-2-oxoglutarate aldolase n=1 Tax=Bordetella genomosp. 4 TaxID=463044 RepID=A0A261TUW2_9BORD|nr:RraA family protein [Bordetella genomosp. 4]OZI52443.1 methyltransferase [Bordetella genomosp. 4]
MSLIGYRVLPRPESAVSSTVLAGFATVGSAQISDCMNRLYGVTGLRPLHAQARRIVGRALTVKARPGDNLMIHKAISLAEAGEVIVVDGGGDTNNALVGELMMMDARMRGVVGFVIDGAVRDADVFAQEDFGCFARGVTHRGPYKEGPGEINVPVSVGGQVVFPGDVVVGDADGVVVIPAGHAEAVLALALKKEADEAAIKEKLNAGTYTKPWVDRIIAQKSGDA